ncbi:MAG: glycosyltransferase 87 family protein [Bacteroidota bacterium]
MAKTRPTSRRQRRQEGRAREARPAPPRRKRRFTLDRWLLALVCLAALLRLWGIRDRLPDPTVGINVLEDTAVEETDRTTMGRAWTLWRGGVGDLDLNPHTGGWPALSFYATLGIQRAYKSWYMATHAGATSSDFSNWVVEGWGARHIFLLARLIGAVIGVVSVALTYRLALALGAGRLVAIGAALLLAVNLPHILVSQHVSDPNLLALLFLLIASFPMIRIARGRGSTRDSVLAGAMIGLAGACKYVPLVVGLPFLLAHPGNVKNRSFWTGALAAFLAFFIATPYTLLDWRVTIRDLTRQRESLFSSWVGQSQFPISLPTYLIQSLPHAMGWIAYLLGILGAVLLWRRGRAERVLVGTAAVLIAVNGLLKAAQERYVLVVMPMLCLAAAAGFEATLRWWRARAAARMPQASAVLVAAVPALIAAVAAAWPIPELAQIRSTLSRPDTRHVSRRWIQRNISPDQPMAVELYGPVFSQDERLFMVWPFFATQAPLVRPAYHPKFLDGVRYFVESGGVSSRFEGDSANYPTEVAFYRWLHANARLLWSTKNENASGPTIEVFQVPDSLSTRAGRDSLFEALVPTPSHTTRLALWCLDLAGMFGRTDAWDRAEEWARRGLRVDAKNMDGQLEVALSAAQIRLNQPQLAEASARAGLAILPRSSSAHFYHGLALRALHRYDEALAELRVAYGLSGEERIRLNYAQLLAEAGRYPEAAEQFEAVPPGSPERGPARRDLAVLYLNNLNRPADAIAALQEAASLEADPRQQAFLRSEIARISAKTAAKR